MYHIIEIQTNDGNSVIVTPIQSASTQNEAESIYHQKMSYAAISQVQTHSVALIDDHGLMLMNGSYEHDVKLN